MSAVIAAVNDVFFAAKIHDAVKKAGAPFLMARTSAEVVEKARSGARLILLDLNDRGLAPIDLLGVLKSDEDLVKVPVVCFLSHVQVDLKKAAQAAGADEVLARSVFSTSLPAILARYTG